MDLFALPIEIRLKIYSELLVHRGPIDLSAAYFHEWSSICYEKDNLFPGLLRLSKQVHSEAISLLYSDNCFQFSNPDVTPTQCHTTFATFIRQVGTQAGLLRHVCIGFPDILALHNEPDSGYSGGGFDDLDLLRCTCPDITTLELLLPSGRVDFILRDTPSFTNMLELMHARLEVSHPYDK